MVLIAVHKEKEKSHVEAWVKFKPDRQTDQLGSGGVGTLLIGPVSPPAPGNLSWSPPFCAYESQASRPAGIF